MHGQQNIKICHTQYTWDSSICIFLFNRTTLQVFVTYRIGALYVHPLWFYKRQHDNRFRSKLFVACQRWWFQRRFWFVPSVPGHLREEEESYLKFIAYDKLLKPRQSFRITLYISHSVRRSSGRYPPQTKCRTLLSWSVSCETCPQCKCSSLLSQRWFSPYDDAAVLRHDVTASVVNTSGRLEINYCPHLQGWLYPRTGSATVFFDHGPLLVSKNNQGS